MVKKADIPDHVIDTAMKLAADGRWRDLSLAEIAEAAKLPISKVYPVYASRQAILDAFVRRIDAAVLAETDSEDPEGSARDRLFDVLMRRFDALDPYKDAVATVAFDQARDPLAALASACQLRRSMALMLEAAGLASGGPRGVLRIKGVALIYLTALRVWLRDESEDKARTMAALDKQLRRAEALVLRLPTGLGGRRRTGSAGPQTGSETGSETGGETA
jgi:AcrR family transcriptional regulator